MGGYLERVRRVMGVKEPAEDIPSKSGALADYEKNELNEKSPAVLGNDAWDTVATINDADELLARWEALGRPEVPLSAGISITNLRTWLQSIQHIYGEDLSQVRRFLWEGLCVRGVEKPDSLLEEWIRVSIPEWRRILQESIDACDGRRAQYARWMLREILLDPDYEESQS